MPSVAIIIGTMPEAVKCAPVIRQLREQPDFTPIVVSTGQHREMLDQTFEQFEIEPDVRLDVMTKEQTLGQVTSRILQGIEEKIDEISADAFAVHGDTGTTLAGALAGFQHRIPVIHIEAGLRSGELYSPFPEEGNRRLVAQIAALHLAPTQGNRANLIREGISEENIVVTGNTVVDALAWGTGKPADYGDPALDDLESDTRNVILASAHRRESWGEPMADIARALAELANDEGLRIIVPMHLNPKVRDVMLPIIAGHPNITVVDPLGYLPFCRLMQRSDIILSDSSGAEEEGPALGKPTLVLRDLTERREAVATGAARLVGRSGEGILPEVKALLADLRGPGLAEKVNPYGDGQATARTVAAMTRFFQDDHAAAYFDPIHHT